jgi:hypothetical protein
MEVSMPKTISSPLLMAALLALGLSAAPAQAQLARTFVSSFGNDANDCNRGTPCRTFQAAHDKTLANGEITVLDPGGYGAVAINKTISIINDGVGEAGMLVSGGVSGVTINGGTNDTVSLRGITIKGIGFGSGNGIVFNSGKFLTIENCAIRNLTQDAAGLCRAIVFQPSSASNFSQIALLNTVIADSFIGINFIPGGTGVARGALTRVDLHNNVLGLFVGPTGTGLSARVSVLESTVNGSSGAGVQVTAPGGATVLSSVMVTGSMLSNNGTALVASDNGFAQLRLGSSSVAGNTASWVTSGGAVFQSYGDNYIAGNDVQPTPPVIARQ